MNNIKMLIKKHKSFIIYGLCSVLITIVDAFIVFLLSSNGKNIVLANTIGVISGSIIQYFIVTKKVFNKNIGLKTFIVFASTFLIGLLLADITIYFSYNLLVGHLDHRLAIILSKLCSIIFPFFFMYNIRKYFYKFI